MPNEIRVLPENVADKIAAGEVAERPSAVVKELTENAIDAGADKITVEIKNGGVKLIRVTDNGSGIPRDQVATAFLRHATSKLRSEEDLYNISTMGFRGEALSSICAVARVEVITRTQDSESGAHYVVDHGVCGEADEIACPCGTIMSVEDLFKNVPARMKFLKKDSTEAGYVTDLMTRLALSKPDISFEYIIDGKTAFVTSGDGDLKNVVLKVYGLKFAKAVMPVDHSEGAVRIRGVIGRPEEISFGNRTRQTVLVNGRYIKNHVISKVAEEAFRNSIMVGRFPFFVLDIILPRELVDVNVHPAKTEVKFANEKELYDIVYHAVKNALYGAASRSVQTADKAENGAAPRSAQTADKAENSAAAQYVQNQNKTQSGAPGFAKTGPLPKPSKSGTAPAHAPAVLRDSNQLDRQVIRDYIEYTTPKAAPPDLSADDRKTDEGRGGSPSPAAEGNDTVQLTLDEHGTNDNPDIFDDCKIIGQVFGTYIILASRDSMYLIDQHAAHERAGFEELKRSYFKNERVSQLLLTPIVVDLTHSEHDALMNNLDTFRRFGFDIADFGTNSAVINETPVAVSDEEIKSLLFELLEAVTDNIRHPIADFEEKALDMISCKKAIKANDILSLPEMSRVVEMVRDLNAKGIKTCPHGRPITVSITKTELEKMFKRLV